MRREARVHIGTQDERGTLPFGDTAEAYDASQTEEYIEDGDILVVPGQSGLGVKAEGD